MKATREKFNYLNILRKSSLTYSYTSPLRTNSFFNVARKTRVRKLRFFYTQKVMHKLGLRSYEKKIIINLKKEQ